MSELSAELRAKLERVRLLVTDVDGVLTDGTLYYGPQGEALKAFSVRDGLGMRMLMERGIEVAVISARQSDALQKRVDDLDIRHCVMGTEEKKTAMEGLAKELGVTPDAIAFVGDDLVDLEALRSVGLSISVSDGHAAVTQEVDWVTDAAGGKGAVREIADAILESQGKAGRVAAKAGG